MTINFYRHLSFPCTMTPSLEASQHWRFPAPTFIMRTSITTFIYFIHIAIYATNMTMSSLSNSICLSLICWNSQITD